MLQLKSYTLKIKRLVTISPMPLRCFLRTVCDKGQFIIALKEAESNSQHHSLEAEPSCVGSKEEFTAQQTSLLQMRVWKIPSSSPALKQPRLLSNRKGTAGDSATGNTRENPNQQYRQLKKRPQETGISQGDRKDVPIHK